MPATKEEEKESNVAACLAMLTLVNGVILVAVSVAAMQSGALHVVDLLVTFDATWQSRLEAPSLMLTTRRIYQVLICVGFLVVAASLLGIAGAKSRQRQLVCTYVIFAGFFAAVMLAGGVQTLQRRAMVEPLITRQVADICNSTTFIRLATHMPCSFAKSYAPSEIGTCGVYCGWRASLLKKLHGCQVMPRLCQQFFYKELESDNCAADIAEGNSTMYMAVESSERCRQLCDEDIRCTAYAYSGASEGAKPERCLLGQGVASAHPPPRWSHLQPSEAAEYLAGGSSISCHRRTQPVVLERFKTHGARLAASTLVLGLFLAASTATSCCLMYNVNLKRQGKPTAHELSLMMCCPCCSGDTWHRFHRPSPFLDDSDADEEEGNSARSG